MIHSIRRIERSQERHRSGTVFETYRSLMH
jgi:hypothetical protein